MLKSSLFVAVTLSGLILAACTPSDAKKSPQAPSASQAEAAAAPAPAATAAPSTLAEAAASVARMGPVPGTYTETDQPINAPSWASCIAVMNVLEDAIKTGKTQGDLAALTALNTEFQAKMATAMPDESEASQMMASTTPFFDELTPEQLKASTELCRVSKDTMAADNV